VHVVPAVGVQRRATPTSARVASCPTNRCSARSPAPSSTDRRPSSTTPNTSVASQRIVPGEPSGKSITQQHAVPPLERLRRHQPAEQRVRLGYHPHPTRQDRTQLLQSVAFTPGTGGDSGEDQESGRSHRGNGRHVRPRRRPNSLGHQRFQVMGVQETLKARLSQPWTNNTGTDLADSGTGSRHWHIRLNWPLLAAPKWPHDQSHIAISVKAC
jgi:hypothetical protein